MLVSEFLNVVYGGKSFPQPIEKLLESNKEIAILDRQLPLYDELLVLETDILQNVRSLKETFFKVMRVASQKVKEITGHGELDEGTATLRLVSAILSQGIYEVRDPAGVSEFDSSKIAKYDELINLLSDENREYDYQTFINLKDSEDMELRVLVFENYEAWLAAGVQGGDVFELVSHIIRKSNLVKPGSDKEVDISDVLNELDRKVFTMLEAFIFANDESTLARLLLYTRLGIDHDIFGQMTASGKKAIVDACAGEIPEVKPTANNEAAPKVVKETEVEEDLEGKSASSVKSRKTTRTKKQAT